MLNFRFPPSTSRSLYRASSIVKSKGYAVIDPAAMAPRLKVAPLVALRIAKELVRAGHLEQGADHLRYRGILRDGTAEALRRAYDARRGDMVVHHE